MPRLRIRHESIYSYGQPVTFGEWRLLMRPTDTHATRLIEATLETPPADVSWSYDAYGNGVCHLQPHASASQLKVVNNLVVERSPSPLADLRTESPSLSGPVVYGLVDRTILEPFIAPATGDAMG